MYVADLTRLSDTPSMTESFPSVVCNGIHSIFGESREHQKAWNAGSSAALTRIAVDYYDVILLGWEEFVHFLTNFEQDIHGWRVVILPFLFYDLVFKLLVIVFPTGQVEDQVGVFVPFLQEGSNLYNDWGYNNKNFVSKDSTYIIYIVSVAFFESRCRKRHPAHPWCHICYI